MIRPDEFQKFLASQSVEFYCGVPDSLLKNFCEYIVQNCDPHCHTITANEGSAVGLATGYALATGKLPLVYLQNSGLGNIINPLLSIADPEVYSIPMLLLIGWRGEINNDGSQLKDEPQHKKQGKLTLPLLETLQIPFIELSAEKTGYESEIANLIETAKKELRPVAVVVRKNTFSPIEAKKLTPGTENSNFPLLREEAIEIVIDALPEETPVVSTTGMISRELFELREKKNQSHKTDFLTVGAMGHTSQIALGVSVALGKNKVVCLDGDGSVIMHMGSLSNNASAKNLLHIVLNNGCHDSVGGQPTLGLQINLSKIASFCNYETTACVQTSKEINDAIQNALQSEGSTLIEIRIKRGNRKNLGRPNRPVSELKTLFSEFLKPKAG